MEIRSLSARAVTAERRLNNAQNQLLATEEKVASMSQKTAAADSKWEARVKEYEARLKSAEERVKRERQGSKERVNELENQLKSESFVLRTYDFRYSCCSLPFLDLYSDSLSLLRSEANSLPALSTRTKPGRVQQIVVLPPDNFFMPRVSA